MQYRTPSTNSARSTNIRNTWKCSRVSRVLNLYIVRVLACILYSRHIASALKYSSCFPRISLPQLALVGPCVIIFCSKTGMELSNRCTYGRSILDTPSMMRILRVFCDAECSVLAVSYQRTKYCQYFAVPAVHKPEIHA